MEAITRFGLQKDRFTIAIMLAVLCVGLMSYVSLPKREDPVVTTRTATVVAGFDGMEPTRVEALIADPIERKIREIGVVGDIETVITPGQALFYVNLEDAVGAPEIAAAWEDLRNKMQAVGPDLPEGAQGPFVNTNFGDVAVATIAVVGDGFDLRELERIAEDLQRNLYTLDGVTEVEILGAQEQRIWLELDNRKLASVGVQLDQVLADLQAQNVILPAGQIDANGTNIILEANGDLRSVDEIRAVLTKVQGLAGYVRLEDLLSVRRGYEEPKRKPIFYNGRPAIVLSVEMAESADVQRRGRDLRRLIETLERQEPIGVSFNIATFQETAITESVSGALANVAQTFVVVLVVMLAFLGFRAALVVACIVPFAVMFALSLMGAFAVDIEKVSIAAVIISLGLLVDNGLVVVEEIEGRINAGEPPESAALAAGGQFLLPLAVASVTTVSAFLPMLLIDGNEGDFAYSLAVVVALMLVGSWLSAIYLLPFLAARLLRPKAARGDGPSPMIRAYGAATRRLLPYGPWVLAATALLVGLSATQFSQLKPEMFPLSERTEVLVYMDMPSGTAISETERHALAVQDWIGDPAANPEVVGTSLYVGSGGPRFYLTLDPAAPNPTSAFFVIDTASHAAAVELAARARTVFIERFPAARFTVTRLSNGGRESGIVDVEIAGPDGDVLLDAAARIQAAVDTAPAITRNENDWGSKELKIVVDIAQDRAREFGVTSEQISSVMAAYFSGARYSTFREGDEQIPIMLRAAAQHRDSVEDFVNLSIAAGGALISIDQIATFRPKLEFSVLRRENQTRQITVSAKSAVLSAQELADRLAPAIAALDLGEAYSVRFGGELEDSAEVYSQLGAGLPAALTVMILALVFQFNSIRRSVITFLTIPIILIGAPFALMAAGFPMAFFVVLGLMSLMGIIINNAIVLIDQIDLESRHAPLDDAIVAAAQKRARPILLTSMTTIFGLVPMAVSGGVLFEPMATVMIGGLLVASPLTLVFVPSVSFWLLRARGRRAAENVAA